jgi:hypothetical protein
MNRMRNISIATMVIIAAAVAADRAAEQIRVSIIRKIIALAVLAIFAAAILGFTSPGHRVLNALGFATADRSG